MGSTEHLALVVAGILFNFGAGCLGIWHEVYILAGAGSLLNI